MYIFEANWSEGFRDSTTKQIVIISWVGKQLKLGTEMVYDPAIRNCYVWHSIWNEDY